MTGKADLKDKIYRAENIFRQYHKNVMALDILQENKKAINDFIQHGRAKGLTTQRLNIYLRMFRVVGPLAKRPFKQLEKGDMAAIFAKINTMGYKPWTIETYKRTLKCFYRWLYDLDSGDPLPPCIKWLKGSKPPQTIQKENLITKTEVKKLVDTTPHLMYKALISVLYEGGLRPGELLNLRIRDVYFNKNHVTLKVQGKMERKIGARDVYLFNSYDILRSWLEDHPFRNDPNHPVWIVTMKNKSYGNPIGIRFLSLLIKKLSGKAGIDKRVWPYLFRHSTATYWYGKYGEAIAKKMLGQAPDSKMSAVYNHLNEEDVLERMKQEHGVKVKKKEDTTETCERCGHINGFGSSLCSKCKKLLDKDNKALQVIDQENLMERLARFADMVESDPDILKIIESPEWKQKQADRILNGDSIRN